jgi:hypothetical protein
LACPTHSTFQTYLTTWGARLWSHCGKEWCPHTCLEYIASKQWDTQAQSAEPCLAGAATTGSVIKHHAERFVAGACSMASDYDMRLPLHCDNSNGACMRGGSLKSGGYLSEKQLPSSQVSTDIQSKDGHRDQKNKL